VTSLAKASKTLDGAAKFLIVWVNRGRSVGGTRCLARAVRWGRRLREPVWGCVMFRVRGLAFF
jgi:hypothetical protein